MKVVVFARALRRRTSRATTFALACAALALIISACASLPVVGTRDSGAKGPATLTGQVTSDRGAVLADVSVQLRGPALHRATRTDVSGRFTFAAIPLGQYTLSASASGYKGAKQRVVVDKEGAVKADFKLRM